MAALPSLRQLRYLVALAETMNFTRAAERSFVSQSTLSAGLKELESTLGLVLVERDKQSLAFTPVGLAVLDRARRLLTAAEDLVDIAKQTSEPMHGLIRLGIIPTIAPFFLPGFMKSIRQEFPALQLALREDLTANLLDRLRARTIDFALIALPYDTEGLQVRPLFDDEFWLAALPDDPAVQGKRIHLPAKVAERLLLLEEGHCLREHSLQACRRTEAASVDGIEATSLLTLIQMVESGMGIALIPEMAIRSGLLVPTALTARPLDAPAPKRVIALVTRHTTPLEREFSILADRMKQQVQSSQQAIMNTTRRQKRASR